MGTPRVPESKPDPHGSGKVWVDIPRTGPLIWVLLAAFLIPPALVAYLGTHLVPIPHQTLWVILLGCPFPLMLLSLPRKYILDDKQLQIVGLVYRVRVPLEEVTGIEPLSTARALFHPGSIYCADPQKALKLTRKKGRALVISPADPQLLLKLQKGEKS